MSLKSLKKQHHKFASVGSQINVLDDHEAIRIPSFQEKLENLGLFPLRPTGLEVLQINVGKMCNQVCKHCHVDAGPDRKEIMTGETMQLVLDAVRDTDVKVVDITGGAPEMNPDFNWFVEKLSAIGKSIIVRCNLTIIVSNPKHLALPEFYKKHNINVVSSLPYFAARRTDAQRGKGVFEKSIRALQMLNKVGYGMPGTDLKLDLVYNPSGAYLPGDQMELQSEFKRKFRELYEIEFNELFAITNLPVSRFLNYLVDSGNYEDYMDELVNAFNPAAACGVMCRNTLSVSWNGYLYDCDFNQMLDLKLENSPVHISEFDLEKINNRSIRINQHCYGCTAGAGSSCGGATT